MLIARLKGGSFNFFGLGQKEEKEMEIKYKEGINEKIISK